MSFFLVLFSGGLLLAPLLLSRWIQRVGGSRLLGSVLLLQVVAGGLLCLQFSRLAPQMGSSLPLATHASALPLLAHVESQ